MSKRKFFIQMVSLQGRLLIYFFSREKKSRSFSKVKFRDFMPCSILKNNAYFPSCSWKPGPEENIATEPPSEDSQFLICIHPALSIGCLSFSTVENPLTAKICPINTQENVLSPATVHETSLSTLANTETVSPKKTIVWQS